jgi:N-acetylglucosamine malate deacetylase 1
MSDTADLLFIGAHPDDLDLCCGGTIAKAARDGVSTGMLELTYGEMGTRGTPQIRKREGRASARILGVRFREQLDFGDGGLRTGREEELQLIDYIRRVRPKLLFAPWPDERHPDHVRAGRIVTDCWFYAGLRQVHTKFPAYRPQAVLYYLQHFMVTPSFVVDVSDTWKTKMKAIAAFKSQFFNPKSTEPKTNLADKKFLDMIDARGRHFGALINVAYGEPFVTKQPPRVDDLIAAYAGREV